MFISGEKIIFRFLKKKLFITLLLWILLAETLVFQKKTNMKGKVSKGFNYIIFEYLDLTH